MQEKLAAFPLLVGTFWIFFALVCRHGLAPNTLAELHSNTAVPVADYLPVTLNHLHAVHKPHSLPYLGNKILYFTQTYALLFF